MKIKIIADNPEDGQSSIKHLIGQEFTVIHKHKTDDGKEDGRVSVIESGNLGLIIIQKDEYEVVEE